MSLRRNLACYGRHVAYHLGDALSATAGFVGALFEWPAPKTKDSVWFAFRSGWRAAEKATQRSRYHEALIQLQELRAELASLHYCETIEFDCATCGAPGPSQPSHIPAAVPVQPPGVGEQSPGPRRPSDPDLCRDRAAFETGKE